MLASIGLALFLVISYHQTPTEKTHNTLIPAVKIGGEFTLVNADGQTVRNSDFLGRFMFIYFGFSYCPDLCPTELQNMSLALDLVAETMPSAVQKIQPIFITIDPERDTPATLKQYVDHFYPTMAGLTGSAEQIAAVAKAYRVYYAKAIQDDSSDYLMDHSSFVYLMGPDGEFRRMFKQNTPPPKMAEALRQTLLEEREPRTN